jgi:hypothetical protein
MVKIYVGRKTFIIIIKLIYSINNVIHLYFIIVMNSLCISAMITSSGIVAYSVLLGLLTINGIRLSDEVAKLSDQNKLRERELVINPTNNQYSNNFQVEMNLFKENIDMQKSLLDRTVLRVDNLNTIVYDIKNSVDDFMVSQHTSAIHIPHKDNSRDEYNFTEKISLVISLIDLYQNITLGEYKTTRHALDNFDKRLDTIEEAQTYMHIKYTNSV